MKASLRRIKLEDLLSKVEQIEQQANLTLAEHPHGHTVERQRLIMAIAKQIRSHLSDQLRLGERQRVAVLADYGAARASGRMSISTANEASASPAVSQSDATP